MEGCASGARGSCVMAWVGDLAPRLERSSLRGAYRRGNPSSGRCRQVDCFALLAMTNGGLCIRRSRTLRDGLARSPARRVLIARHCEERSDAAIHLRVAALLATTARGERPSRLIDNSHKV